jgi:hypothetical protein
MASNSVLPVTHYEVTVYTGDRWGADTDASIYITLYGSKGDFGKRWLYATTENEPKDMFLRNQVSRIMTFRYIFYIIVSPYECTQGYYGLVVVPPPPPRP